MRACDGRQRWDRGLHVMFFATLVLMAMTEQFASLLGAGAALAPSWYVVRP